jgi:outer membrane protein assembly factor BamB
MIRIRRAAGILVFVGLISALGLSLTSPADGQVQPGMKAKFGPGMPKDDGTPGLQYSAIKLIEKSEYRQYVQAAQAAIKDAQKSTNPVDKQRAWDDAVTVLQTILDNKEDFYVSVRQKDAQGQETARWTSVKFEANNLLGSMPEEGLDYYELKVGGKARELLDQARTKGDRELLADVAQRYLHTRAGTEATELLATYFLDRGQYFVAALRFERLLGLNANRVKTSALTQFKAALAYRRAGDIKNADLVMKRLEADIRDKGGLKVGDELVPVAKLQALLEQTPRPENANPHDWPLVRGNHANNAQAKGSQPLLDTILWQRPTVLDKDDIQNEVEKGKEARHWVDRAIERQNTLSNAPVLPGSFPIVAGGMMIYRSYLDIRAVHLRTGKDAVGEAYRPGEIAWKTTEFDGALSTVLEGGFSGRATLENWLNIYQTNAGFLNLVYENTLLGTLACDQRLVYAVDDLAVPAPSNQFLPYVWNSAQIHQDLKPLVLENSLHAYNLHTGKFEWRLGGPKKDDTVKDDTFRDSHFLGVPLSVGGKLFVLNEKNPGFSGDAELRLVCIDPTKLAEPGRPHVFHLQPIGAVQQQHRITHDLSRRINAVHLAYGEGILVCPTNAGELLGIDLLTRSLAWAYPYKEDRPTTQPVNPNQPFMPGGVPGNMPLSLTQHWKSAPPVIQDGRVVFTAPDATSIHCLNLRDGTLAWKKPQVEGDLFLGGVIDGKVLIVGKNAVRGRRLADGEQVMYVPTGDLPSGQGVASKNVYHLPLKNGEICAIDVEKALIKSHNRAKKTGAIVPGNLVFYEGMVLSQTPKEVVAYPQLVAKMDAANRAVVAEPNNPEKLIDRGEIRLADGQVHNAVEDLKKALALSPPAPLASRAKESLYDALSDLFQVDFNSASEKYLEEYHNLSKLPENPDEQQKRLAKFYRVVGQGREAQGKLVEAFQMYRDFGALPINKQQGVAALDDPSFKVPTPVWLRGRISAMIAKATPEQRQPLEAKIADEWKAIESKNDPEAFRNFAGMFDVPFAVGREARLRLAETIIARNERNSFLEAELNLQQLRVADLRKDPKVGGKALAALALLEEKKGTADAMKLAAAYYRQSGRDFPDVILRDGKTGKDFFNALAEDKRFLPFMSEGGTLWARANIKAHEVPAGHFPPGTQGFIFQPEGDVTPLMRNHRLVLDPSNANSPRLSLVDLTTNSVRWTQNLGSVQTNFQFFQYLYQQGQANTSYYPNARFRFFQVKGHLAVFQVGTMVYCLDLDSPRILWEKALIDGNPNQPNMVVQQVLPDQDGNLELMIWNQFNGQRTRMRIGQVGAVQASYVALATQKGLTVLDPLRGTPLWSKTDIPARTQVFGDDQHIYLVDTREGGGVGATRILRAGDGAPVDAPDFGFVYQKRIRLMGRHILASINDKDDLRIKLYDILTGKDIWSKAFDARSVVLDTEDPNLTGVIGPDGKLMAIDVPSGKELLSASVLSGRITPDELKSLKQPLLLRDNEHYYVALNQPIDTNVVAGGVVSNNFSNGLRCHPINGWFVALQAKDGERKDGDQVVRWKKGDFHWHSYMPVKNQMIVLEQFDNLPVILFSSRYNEMIKGGAGGNRWVAVTQSLDKRNGKVIWDPGQRMSNSAAQYYAFNLDLKAGTINMVGFNNALQHYVDDGRKRDFTLPAGSATPIAPGGPPANPFGPGVMPLQGFQRGGAIMPMNIIVRPAVVAPRPAPVEKK